MRQERILDGVGHHLATIYQEENGDKDIRDRNDVLLGYYRRREDTTYDKDGKKVANGDYLITLIGYGRFYVYTLIDPTNNNKPFYIGKGFSNRLRLHFSGCKEFTSISCSNLKEGQDSVGLSPKEIIQAELGCDNEYVSDKDRTILALRKRGVKDEEMARVICRRVSEEVALAVEAALIKSHYGLLNLKNKVEGQHAERFRPYDHWEHIPTYDLVNEEGDFLEDQNHPYGRYYVYALIHPTTNEVFYIGKGTRGRIRQHFKEATIKNKLENDKLREIKELINQGYKQRDIGRIVARVDSEALAFMLETLWIKFIKGFRNISNVQSGHASHLFRSKDDWSKRRGFDLPFIVEPGKQNKRDELLDLFLGAGLDELLEKVREELCENGNPLNLKFGPPKVEGAGELAIRAVLDEKITLQVQTRHNRTLQVALMPTNKRQKDWIIDHFRNILNNAPIGRADFRFTPRAWKNNNVTSDVSEAANRARLLVKLANLKRRDTDDLNMEALLID